MTTWPRRSTLEMRSPSSVTRVAAGAGAPTRRPPAHDGGASHTLPARHASPWRNARRALLRGQSEGIAHSPTRGPTGKQLESIEVAVDRQLHEGERVHPRRQLHGRTRAEIGNAAGRVLQVRECPLIGRLVQQVHLQLRDPPWISLVAQAKAHGDRVARPEVVTGLIHALLHRTLE